MKFKIAVIGLLIAILATFLFTSYALLDNANKQLELQKLQVKISIETFEFENFNNKELKSTYFYEWYDEYNEICKK